MATRLLVYACIVDWNRLGNVFSKKFQIPKFRDPEIFLDFLDFPVYFSNNHHSMQNGLKQAFPKQFKKRNFRDFQT